MNNRMEKQKREKTAVGGCGGSEKPGKSQRMQQDETTENDIVGASNYERAESDQSKGMFVRQTEAYNKTTDKMMEDNKARRKE